MVDEEWFDVVDMQDNVLRSAPRSEVHGNGWLHRAVHIWIENSAGELLVHQRTAHKEEEPSKWTSSASGHVSAGESYATAAERELVEELGISTELEELHKIAPGPDVGYEHTVLFLGKTDEMPQPDPREILTWKYLSWHDVKDWYTSANHEFTNPFRKFLEWRFESE